MVFRGNKFKNGMAYHLVRKPPHGFCHRWIDIEDHAVPVNHDKIGQIIKDYADLFLALTQRILSCFKGSYIDHRRNAVPGIRYHVDMDKTEMDGSARIDKPAFIHIRDCNGIPAPFSMILLHPIDIVRVDESCPALLVLHLLA
ncbi:MAG: hypothetical protein A4E42_01774 [Methanoregulaceae archaeon PtaU1.Bin222]|nr:MAG: hypothetical protein A4E42_01774 [Methanoregulaceae archaeon PtaU1.Bin222]